VERPAELADEPLSIKVYDFADQRGTMAVHTAVAAGAQGTNAVAEERYLHQGVPVASEGQHGFRAIRHGQSDPSIDPVPKIGRRSMQEDVQHTGTLPGVGRDQVPVVDEGERRERPAWVDEARAGLDAPGKYLAYDEDGRKVVVAISREWTRIGRSLAADVRFDDATVSRRHALVVNQTEGVRVLDDRSLNGILVNGSRVEWSPLADGDEITVGRHSLFFLDTATVGAPIAATPSATTE
jgi:FHA domain-containing protein